MDDLRKSYHLGSRLGEVLDRLIADRPDLGWTEVAALFESITGRKISAATVRQRYRRKSGTSPRFLTDEQRELLLRLCRESAPDYNRSEIARDFALASGRPITHGVVGRFIRKYLGVPKALLGRKRTRPRR